MSDADFYNSFAYCNILNNLIYREYSIAINSAAIQLATHANGIAKKQTMPKTRIMKESHAISGNCKQGF